MVRLVLVLLIALLPLRGWSGERMAVAMATHDLVTAQTVAHAADHQDHSMSADCPMTMARADAMAGDAVALDGDDNGIDCHACQLCMSLLAVDMFARKPQSLQPYTVHAAHADRFDSADLARVAKPPIH